MSSHDVRVEVVDHVAWIRLDRPERRNALGGAMTDELRAQLDRLAHDSSVRALVLTGDDRAFCAGVDLRNVDDESERPLAERLGLLLEEIWAFPSPTLALVRGACIGVGCAIATACDVRFAHPEATFAVPGVRLGIPYPTASMKRLIELVGIGHANVMLLGGRPVRASQASTWGLVDAAAVNVEQEALGFLRAVVEVDPDVVRGARLAIRDLSPTAGLMAAASRA